MIEVWVEQVVRGEVAAGQLPPVGAYMDAVRARAAEKGTPLGGARAICAGADCEFDSLLQARLRERAAAADAHSAAGQVA